MTDQQDNHMPDATIRRARPDEAQQLGEITMNGLFHWGHGDNFPELIEYFRKTNLPSPDYIRESPVYVLEEDAQIIGFYGLEHKEDDELIEMTYIFVDPTFIGQGYGKLLWQDAIRYALDEGYKKMLVFSDPAAVGFYTAMGAKRELDQEVYPGFFLTKFWFDLSSV